MYEEYLEGVRNFLLDSKLHFHQSNYHYQLEKRLYKLILKYKYKYNYLP
jgi:hypothetical protein